ncbi:type II secretion system F family protein [Patulibacter defluvii]|uniref:type II secretion system F family protein n=1 Tax=Patulibacter defluvii TaxID=3095358 RepID=UPI002A765318|nr:type II secretion system F family protein [Patulibacter sp. DM4]
MTVAVLLAALAGGLLAVAIVTAAPELVRVVVVVRARWGTAGSLDRWDRAVPGAAVAGSLLVLVGAPAVGVLVAGGPLTARTLGRRRVGRRRAAVARGAPAVARAIADALDAGHGVRRALLEAAGTAGPAGPAADELRRVAARLQAGDPLPAALAAWRARASEPAHATVVAGLLLHGEAGGELADVLRQQADALERARRATAEADSATVQARTAARIVGGIPVVIAVGAALFAPAAVRAITATPLGVALVTGAVLLQVAATVAVRRLTAGLVR